MNMLVDSPLGKTSSYESEYNRDLLFALSRQIKRDEISVPAVLPFQGFDIWNAYEISWLNLKGKPIVALGEFIFPCESPNIIESKSFKLYLNSFNNTKLKSIEEVQYIMQQDLSAAVGANTIVKLTSVENYSDNTIGVLSGNCIDNLDVECDTYRVNPSFLHAENEIVTEVLYSHLLKSNCLVTGQPDWGSVQIQYTGKKINHEGLLKYIVSFRNHNEFHEQCVERIFMDILTRIQPEKLSVLARYTRRGGLDINPFRSTHETIVPENFRLCRQ